jgi:hypothetical protein
MNSLKVLPVDITDLIAITALSIGFVMSIWNNMMELSMSLATGFFGYIGGYTSGSNKTIERKPHDMTKFTLDEDISPEVITNNEESSKK